MAFMSSLNSQSDSTNRKNPRGSEMVHEPDEELLSYCRTLGELAKKASLSLLDCSTAAKNKWLHLAADEMLAQADSILEANAKDLAAAPGYSLSPAAVDRLTLTRERIEGISLGFREIASLPDPVGELIGGGTRPNGLQVQKVRVPIGVILFIYESRPNVTADAAAIAIKSGNAIILRGGKEAFHSSVAIVQLLQQTATHCGIPEGAIQLVETLDRDAVGALLRQSSTIDVAIPRGGESLVRRVVAEATMPVLKHFDGNCHVYVDRHADLEMAVRIVINAKTQRMGVCNAAESLLVDAAIAPVFLKMVEPGLKDKGIELRGDVKTCSLMPSAVKGTEEDWSKEYLGPIMSVCVVDGVDAAISHINR
jgi:glutamate-5-semialdehyde dehydrogenase